MSNDSAYKHPPTKLVRVPALARLTAGDPYTFLSVEPELLSAAVQALQAEHAAKLTKDGKDFGIQKIHPNGAVETIFIGPAVEARTQCDFPQEACLETTSDN